MRPLPALPLALALAAIVLLAGLATPSPAPALVGAAATIDGPSVDVLGLDGIAIAEDGTGGLVYRKRVDGRVHVFVSRWSGRRWQPPQQVDAGQRFDSSWPAIGAGNGGRLVVTWIHQYGGGVQNRLFSAALDPGARRFQAPVAIDLDVREGLDAAPSLSMGPGGVAYLAYRVVYARQSPLLPPGTIDADIRVQRYSGSFWSQLGQPVDRILAQPQAMPTDFNGPQIATDVNGNAVVAWIEPDDQLIPRAYARRLFGQVLGNVLPASPADVGGVPLRAPVDQLSLAVAPFGETIVGMRQQGDGQSPWTRPRALVNMLPSSLAEGSGRFLGPRPVDGGVADGPAGALGPLSVSVDDRGGFEAGLSIDAQAFAVGGDETTVGGHARLDDGTPRSAPDPLLARGAEGSLAAAWKVEQGPPTHGAGVGLLERRADGTPVRRIVSAQAGGAVAGLKLAGSPLGSALAGWVQGREAGRQIAAAAIEAPPGSFTVQAPLDWTRDRQVPITWERAHSASGRLTYTVQVDGEDLATGLTDRRRTLAARQVGDGDHELAVVATDGAEQATTSLVARLLIDRTAPVVRLVRAGRRGVRTQVADGVRGQSSGLARVRIAWGDGGRGRGARATHRYRAPGRYRVRVTARDRAGNVRRSVRTVVLR